MKLPKDLRGKYVTRAAFAKMQAEKHRLEKDIRTMVMGNMADAILVKEKWRKEFQFWKDFHEGLREIARRELPELRKKYPDLGEPKIDQNKKAFK